MSLEGQHSEKIREKNGFTKKDGGSQTKPVGCGLWRPGSLVFPWNKKNFNSRRGVQ